MTKKKKFVTHLGNPQDALENSALKFPHKDSRLKKTTNPRFGAKGQIVYFTDRKRESMSVFLYGTRACINGINCR